ncbi:MAG: type II secretion system protein N [Hyphomonas sp.]
MASLFRTERGISLANIEHAGRVAVESLLVVTVGVLLGRLAWSAVTPSGTTSAGQELVATSSAPGSELQTSLLTQMNPFGSAPATQMQAQPGAETSLDIRLAGVRAVTGNAMASSAVIAFPDGLQKRLVPGDEVMPGIVLVNVTAEAVHLSRNGALETLSLHPGRLEPFAPADTSQSMDIAAPSAPETRMDITPAALVADTTLTPEFRDGQVSGYRLEPRGDGAFEKAGLMSGDLILRINGQAIEGLRPDQISQTVAGSADVMLDVVRQGAIVRLRVAPDASLSQ